MHPTDNPFHIDGGIAVCRIYNLRRMLSHITAEGYEHHAAMVSGHYTAVVQEGIAKILGWDAYWHGGPDSA